jgi:WD40 repeat protein
MNIGYRDILSGNYNNVLYRSYPRQGCSFQRLLGVFVFYLVKMGFNFFKIVIYVNIFLAFVSCSSSRENDPLSAFKGKSIQLKSNFIDTDRPVLSGDRVFMITDSALAVTTIREDTLLTIVRIRDGKILRRMIRKGVGPGELTTVGFCPQTDKNQLFVHDPNQGIVLRLDMETIMNVKSHQIEPFARIRSSFMCKVDSFFVVSGHTVKDHRFQILGSKGNIITSYLHYQKPKEYQHLSDHQYSIGRAGDYTVHPDYQKFVFASSTDGHIQIFNFAPDSISLDMDLFFYASLFSFEGRRVIHDKNSKLGFAGADSDERFVYTLYSEKTIEDFFRNPGCRHLLVFDWEGKPVKRFVLDIPLISFCLNAAGDKIYGIAFNPETVIVQYDLK